MTGLSSNRHTERGGPGLVALLLCLALAWLAAAPAGAQEGPDLKPELRKLQQAALSSDYALTQIDALSNTIGPRLSGSVGAARAVDYVAEQLRALGLKVTLEECLVPHWVRGQEAATAIDYPGRPQGIERPIILTALGDSGSTGDAGLTAEVVCVTSMAELEALGRTGVAGKIVLFNVPFDARMAKMGEAGPAYGQAVRYRAYGPGAAAKLGARAGLVRSVGGADFRLPHTGGTHFEADQTPVPAAAVTAEDADWLARMCARGKVRMRLVLTPQSLPPVKSYNVIGDLPGREHPEEIVIVSGHLDSWDLGTGALDDASGVAMAMACAKLFRQLGLQPRRTLRVIAWMNEENGLAGGKTYAQNHADQMALHKGAIESDFGAGHPAGIEVKASPEWMARLKPVAEVLLSQGAGVLHPAQGTGADISPLGSAGVPCFHPLQDGSTYFNYHHTMADTFDKVDPQWLRENVSVMAVLAYALCNLP